MGVVDRDAGLIYVPDFVNNRVQVFDLDGNFVEKWGSAGNKPGQFVNPTVITLDADGNLWIGEASNGSGARVQKLDPHGNYLGAIGVDGELAGEPYRFTEAWGLAFDAQGNLFVCDYWTNTIIIFDPDLNKIGEIHDVPGAGPLNVPIGLTFDDAGYLYVVDGANNRVLKLETPAHRLIAIRTQPEAAVVSTTAASLYLPVRRFTTAAGRETLELGRRRTIIAIVTRSQVPDVGNRTGIEQWRKCEPTTSSSSAADRPAACWPTASPPTPIAPCSSSRPDPTTAPIPPIGRKSSCTPRPRRSNRTPGDCATPAAAPFCRRAKVLGGQSAVNACYWIRGSAADYDQWEALGNPGWGFEGLLPYFRKAESDPLGGPLHGTDGPVAIDREQNWSPGDAAWVEAAANLGLEEIVDINGAPEQFPSVGPAAKNLIEGVRASSVMSYLNPVRSRPNLTVRRKP